MTIGIVAAGPRAGLAVYAALQAVERVAQGAIGGFASFAAVTETAVLRHETQRGGSATLFTAGEQTGGPPGAAVAEARLAGVMSSGPDRPAPLAQFLPALPGVGLVSGHRLPNMAGQDGQPINGAVLALLQQGLSPAEAVAQVLEANPQADAGVIAGTLDGRIHAQNSSRVNSRPDLGRARGCLDDALVEVLHNAIFPVAPLATLAVEIALDTMLSRLKPDGEVVLRGGTPVVFGAEDQVLVDAEMNALEVQTTDPRLISGTWNCAAVYLGAKVLLNGTVLGETAVEPNILVEDGRILSMSGQQVFRLGFRKQRKP